PRVAAARRAGVTRRPPVRVPLPAAIAFRACIGRPAFRGVVKGVTDGATHRSGDSLGLLLGRSDHGVNVFCGPGLAKKVSLSLGAAGPLQVVEFLLRLESFRGRFDSKADGQLRNGADDGPA